MKSKGSSNEGDVLLADRGHFLSRLTFGGAAGPCKAFLEDVSTMHLRSDSAAGARFLASMRVDRGSKPSARALGRVGTETGPRWDLTIKCSAPGWSVRRIPTDGRADAMGKSWGN